MSQHVLQGRTESEVLWFQRRSFISAAAAWTAMGGFASAQAQSRSNVVELRGDAQLNGQRMTAQQTVQTGDRIETGPGSNLIFVVGNASFQMRQNSMMVVERGATLSAVSVLRLIAGGVASVWGRGSNRQINMPTITAGIRGTGVYSEIFANQNGRNYFCNCYGTVDMTAGQDKTQSQSSYHQAFWGEVEPRNGRMLNPAGAINHTDEELEVLARLINQRTTWQVSGVKGVKDGRGYMENKPGQMHPAEMLGK
jgi:hypothetical protein